MLKITACKKNSDEKYIFRANNVIFITVLIITHNMHQLAKHKSLLNNFYNNYTLNAIFRFYLESDLYEKLSIYVTKNI